MKEVWVGTVIVAMLFGGCGKGEGEKKTMVKKPDTKMINILVFSTKGCVNTPPAKKIIEETAIEMGVNIDMKSIIVSTQKEANRYKFHGSPTILVNGVDLDPGMRDNTTYGFT